jgi:hypothetical protein
MTSWRATLRAVDQERRERGEREREEKRKE